MVPTKTTVTKAAGRRTIPPRGAAWFAAGVIALLVVAILPATRFLVRQQWGGMTGDKDGILASLGMGGDRDAQNRTAGKIRAAAERHPEDAAAQIVAALTSQPETRDENDDPVRRNERRQTERQENLLRLQALAKRFPNDARVPATLLLDATLGTVALRRPDLERMYTPPSKDGKPFKPAATGPSQNLPEMVAAFADAAAHGETIDPDNAFFPAMSAVACLVQNRDGAAIAALHRAAAKPRFEDYAGTDALTRAKLLAEINGGPLPAPARMAIYASALFPHYAALRGMARDMAVLATQAEERGADSANLQIRQDLSRVGARMRIDSHFAIGSLVGIAITNLASSRFDGKNFLTDVPSDETKAIRLTEYITRLNDLGQKPEAVWYLAELEKGAKVKSIIHSGMDRGVFGLRDLMAAIIGGAMTSIYLPCAAAALCFGVVTFLFARRLAVKTGWVRFRLSALYLLCVTGTVGGLLFWAATNFCAAFGFMSLLQVMSGSGDGTDMNSARLALWALVAPFLLLALLPVRQMGKMCRSGWRNRKTVWQNAAERVPGDALKLVGLCLLCFSGSAWFLSVQEAYVHQQLTELVQHEGRQYARLIDQEWPGAVGEKEKPREDDAP